MSTVTFEFPDGVRAGPVMRALDRAAADIATSCGLRVRHNGLRFEFEDGHFVRNVTPMFRKTRVMLRSHDDFGPEAA